MFDALKTKIAQNYDKIYLVPHSKHTPSLVKRPAI
jgi:hypothetical protein